MIALPKCKLTFDEAINANVWDWGTKPLVIWDHRPMFAELAIAEMFRGQGWQAYWSEAYGGTVYLDRMPDLPKGSMRASLARFGVDIDPNKAALVEKIRGNCNPKNWSCLDVVAWKDDRTVFVDAKHRGRGKAVNGGRKVRDRLTKAQLLFIDSALRLGMTVENNFLIAEWEFSMPLANL